MKYQSCAFYSGTMKLDFLDMLKLILGMTLKSKWGSPMINLYKIPDNKCPQCNKVRK